MFKYFYNISQDKLVDLIGFLHKHFKRALKEISLLTEEQKFDILKRVYQECCSIYSPTRIEPILSISVSGTIIYIVATNINKELNTNSEKIILCPYNLPNMVYKNNIINSNVLSYFLVNFTPDSFEERADLEERTDLFSDIISYRKHIVPYLNTAFKHFRKYVILEQTIKNKK